MSKDLNKCPKCGSMAKRYLYSTTTMVYNPATYDKEGNLVTGTNPNKTTNHYSCIECQEKYSVEQ